MDLRTFVSENSIQLPPVAAKADAVFNYQQLEAEQGAYAAIVRQYNEAGLRELKPFWLGRLGLIRDFGPVGGYTIIAGLIAAAQQNPVLAELLEWMAPGTDGVDIGTADAGELLDSLVAAEVLTSEQRAVLESKRTRPLAVDEMQAWNELHTWIEGRPL